MLSFTLPDLHLSLLHQPVPSKLVERSCGTHDATMIRSWLIVTKYVSKWDELSPRRIRSLNLGEGREGAHYGSAAHHVRARRSIPSAGKWQQQGALASLSSCVLSCAHLRVALAPARLCSGLCAAGWARRCY